MLLFSHPVLGGASELAFLKEPNDVIAVRDRPLMLDCQVEGEGPISVTWRRNGVPVPTGPKASVLANGTLLIKSFQKRRESNETDAGEYDCAAQNHYGMLISRKARVQLACKLNTPQTPTGTYTYWSAHTHIRSHT